MLPALFSSPVELSVGPVLSRLQIAQRQQASQEIPPRRRRTTATRRPVGIGKSSGSFAEFAAGSCLDFVVAVLGVSIGVKTFQ